MNILIIEDDQGLGKRIHDLFNQIAITNRIHLIYSFQEFLNEYISISLYDLVLTDLNLGNYKESEGFEIIKKIREINTIIPIIVISGYDDIDKLRYAFSLGISDYIIKPIRLKELEVRVLNWIHAHYLGPVRHSGNIYKYKDFTYNKNQNKFYFREKYIPLSKNNKYILSLFFAEPEKILSEKYLGEKIWGDICYSGKRNIRVSILRLKKKLAIHNADTWIQNIHSEGYIFAQDPYCKI